MVSAGREPITGCQAAEPQQGPQTESLVRELKLKAVLHLYRLRNWLLYPKMFCVEQKIRRTFGGMAPCPFLDPPMGWIEPWPDNQEK